MRKELDRSSGFTLVELMIVIAIVGILASVAVPQYAQYSKRAKFSQVIIATARFKTAVHLCVQDMNTLSGCSSGANGVPAPVTSPVEYLESLSAQDGLITSKAVAELDGLTYTLQPGYDSVANSVTWTVGGTCLDAGFCRN